MRCMAILEGGLGRQATRGAVGLTGQHLWLRAHIVTGEGVDRLVPEAVNHSRLRGLRRVDVGVGPLVDGVGVAERDVAAPTVPNIAGAVVVERRFDAAGEVGPDKPDLREEAL